MRDSALCLCELGWLYGKVVEYTARMAAAEAVDVAEDSAATTTGHKGLVIQAFVFAIQVGGQNQLLCNDVTPCRSGCRRS